MSALLRPSPPRQRADADLIAAHLDGDHHAFAELFDRHCARLVAALQRRVGDRGRAEDLAQEAFVRVLHALDRYDPARPFWPWLHRIGINLATDQLRARKHDALVEELPQDETLESPRHDGDAVASALGERALLDAALRQLPPRQRLVLVLGYYLDLPPAEIASHLRITSHAHEQLRYRALLNLSRHYQRLDAARYHLSLVLVWLVAKLPGRWRDRVQRTSRWASHTRFTTPVTVSDTVIGLMLAAVMASAAVPHDALAAPPIGRDTPTATAAPSAHAIIATPPDAEPRSSDAPPSPAPPAPSPRSAPPSTSAPAAATVPAPPAVLRPPSVHTGVERGETIHAETTVTVEAGDEEIKDETEADVNCKGVVLSAMCAATELVAPDEQPLPPIPPTRLGLD